MEPFDEQPHFGPNGILGENVIFGLFGEIHSNP